MTKVVWPTDALDQLYSIVAYIRLFDPAAAARFSTRLLALGDGLVNFPHRGRPAQDDTRELVTVPPYILRYRVAGDVVTILSIRHGARLPDFD